MDNSEIVETSSLPGISCAGIAIDDKKIILYINPERFSLLSEAEKAGVLTHEYLHILLGHLDERAAAQSKNIKVLNIAQDMIINQLIIKGGLSLPSYVVYNVIGDYNLKPLQSAEFYYNELIKDIPKFEKHFGPIDEKNPDEQLNDHSGWEFGTKSASKKIIGRIGKEFAESEGAQVGSILSGTEYCGILERIKAKASKTNWVLETRHLLQTADAWSNKRIDYKRPSRRIEDSEFIHPSYRKSYDRCRWAAIVDISGSMRPHIPYVIGELNKLSQGAELDIYFCDIGVTQVINNYTAKAEIEVAGYGGTLLQPAFTMAYEAGSKAVIVLTDGFLSGQDIDTHEMDLIWGIYNNPTFSPSIGKVVRIEVEV